VSSRDILVAQLQGAFRRVPTRKEEATLTLGKTVPNTLTLLALVIGLSTVPLAIEERFAAAVACVFLAGVCDGLDGPVARALNSTSRFGAELDSLCDLVNFGVAPTILLYLWRFATLGWQGWALSLIWCLCMACRLARFNAGVDFNQAKWSRNFFMGVPAPAGAFLACAPMVLSFRDAASPYLATKFLVPYHVLCCFLLVSDVPTFSSKMIHRGMFAGAPRKLAAAAAAAALVYAVWLDVWLVYLVAAAVYMTSFPVAQYHFAVLAAEHHAHPEKPE
jgi:CDP-diacylglycerol--serine O-phosphatidyltransferase